MALLEATLSGLVLGIISIIAGILVIAFPGFLRYLVGIYLVIVGLLMIL